MAAAVRQCLASCSPVTAPPRCSSTRPAATVAHPTTRSSSSRTPRPATRLVVRAGGGDIDEEWRSYVNQRGGAQQQGADSASAAGSGRRSSVYTTTSGGSSGSSSSRRARMPVDAAAKLTRDAIKREESLLLNAWTSDRFQGAGVAIAVLVLLTLLLAAGPPPSDGRCTLPWC